MTMYVCTNGIAARPQILNLEPKGYSDDARLLLESIGDVTDGPLSRAALMETLPAYDILIVRLAHQIDKEVIDAGKRLQVIVSGTTGLDHIDLTAARSKQISVLSLRGEEEFLRGITATAEMTWALLLALMRRIPEAVSSVRAGQWNRDAVKGRDLYGRRLGIVGLGRVGRQVAEFGTAFQMSVAAYDPFVTYWPQTVLRKHSLAALLRESDVVSIHVNLHPGTVGFIGHHELALLPQGAVVINTSRGEVMDDQALVEALESGRVDGAALDVIPQERREEMRQNSRLILYAATHQNLLITPHAAGATHEAMRKTEVFMANKLIAFLGTSPLATHSGV
jgi:D-3-phosphoglycerate dehydrogenase